MKNKNRTMLERIKRFSPLFLVCFMVLLAPDLMAQFSTSAADNAITTAAENIEKWTKLVIGIVFLMGGIFVTWSLITNQPNSRQHVIGTIVAFVVMGLIYAVLGISK